MNVEVNLQFSESAIKQLKRTKEDNNLGVDDIVRLAVAGGGCSGFMYDMQFIPRSSVDEQVDFVQDHDGIEVVVDRKSLLYLDGTTVDWHDDLNQRGFKFLNPNAQKSCGCGQSFGA